MPIITRTEVKRLLSITDSSYDIQIEQLIPVIQPWLIEYLNNAFRDPYIYVIGNTFAFNENTPAADTITDSQSGFVSAGFSDGDELYIEGPTSNRDMVFTASTVTADTITLSASDDVVDEDDGYYIRISKVRWPNSIKRIVAEMIWHDIKTSKDSGMKTERIGDYSYTRETGAGGYPTNITRALKPFRRPRFA